MLAYNVARRRREIGTRMALGANAGHVRGLVVRGVRLMLVIGTVARIASAAARGKFLQSFLYGMKARDMAVYGSAAVVLWQVALEAAYVPACRATGVDPMIAL